MKLNLTYSGLALLLPFVLGACDGKKSGALFTLEAENLPAATNGSYAYVINTLKEPIDSVMITDGGFVYSADADSQHIYGITIGNETVVNELIFEGNGKLLYGDSLGYYLEWPMDQSVGDNLNIALRNFRGELEEQVAPLAQQVIMLGYDRLRAKDDPKKVERLSQQMDSLFNIQRDVFNGITDKYYTAHSSDAVAISVFREIGFKDEADYVKKYNVAPSVVKEDPLLLKRFEDFSFILETSAGKMYKDFEMDDTEGNVVRLSDYMVDGQYLLVDFWASWCGPCRKGIPHLAALHKEYGNKGLRVLSIGLSEKNKADNDKAIEELGITWDHFYDGKGTGGDTYGFQTIPTLLLIAPDGMILVRTSNPQDMDSVLKEALGNL